MKVTPLEIRQQQFPVRFRGLDPAEVDKFLELVASDLEELMRENARLKDGLSKKDQELERMQQGENELKKALMGIQQIREDWIGRAEQQAEQVLRESEAKATQMMMEAESKLAALRQDMQELGRQKHHLLSQLRTILDQHTNLLEATASGDVETESQGLQEPLGETAERQKNTARMERGPHQQQDV
jgi:cell division initiation protein